MSRRSRRERGRVHGRAVRAGRRGSPRRVPDGAVLIFALVFAAQFAFGVWMASRGFRWGDAFYRSTSALFVLHSADPKLADIGFVWMPLPTLLNLPWAALYPVWPNVIASGAASVAGERRVRWRDGRDPADTGSQARPGRAGSAGRSR